MLLICATSGITNIQQRTANIEIVNSQLSILNYISLILRLRASATSFKKEGLAQTCILLSFGFAVTYPKDLLHQRSSPLAKGGSGGLISGREEDLYKQPYQTIHSPFVIHKGDLLQLFQILGKNYGKMEAKSFISKLLRMDVRKLNQRLKALSLIYGRYTIYEIILNFAIQAFVWLPLLILLLYRATN